MKRVSVIIPNLNSEIIHHVCRALRAQTVSADHFEVLVVGVDKPGLVQEDELITSIATDEKALAPAKRNLGMERATGEIFLFLDSDCVPHPDWLECHLDLQEKGEKIVGGSVTFDKENYYQLADNVSAFHDLLPHMPAGKKPYLATANLSVHRSVVERAGKMLPHLDRAHDLEWTVRFRKLGYWLYFEPTATVIHDPPRRNISIVWRHWFDDAHDTLLVRLRYAQLLHTPGLANRRWLYLWLAPVIAAWATRYTFENRQTLRQYWTTLPLVYLTKIAWCMGAFRCFPSYTGENEVDDPNGEYKFMDHGHFYER